VINSRWDFHPQECAHAGRTKMDARVKPAQDELCRNLSRPRQRAVDHRDRVREAIDRNEGTEARAFFLT
jgi:hypothetical protein